jgi:hypothetical protein
VGGSKRRLNQEKSKSSFLEYLRSLTAASFASRILLVGSEIKTGMGSREKMAPRLSANFSARILKRDAYAASSPPEIKVIVRIVEKGERGEISQ